MSGDYGLVLKSKAKHSAVSAKLKKPFPFDEKPLIVQYEVNFQKGQDCGGGYIKLLTHQKVMGLRNESNFFVIFMYVLDLFRAWI